MENTPHVLLGGIGANKFAASQGIATVPSGSLVTKKAIITLESFKKQGGQFTEVGQLEVSIYSM